MTEQPWWMRTPILVGVVLVVVALLAGGGLLLFGGSSESADNAGPAPASDKTAAQSSSLCDLPDGSMEPPTAAPEDTRWVIAENGVAVPSVPRVGPGDVSPNGYRYCFARNPLGAVVSAMWFAVDVENHNLDRKAFAADRLAGMQEQLEFVDEPAPADTGGVEFRGFRFPTTPTRDEATVELLVFVMEFQELRSVTAHLVWDTSDWRLKFPAPSLEVVSQADASEFVEWADPAISGAPGLGRPALAWSLRGEDEVPAPDPPFTRREQKWADGFVLRSGSAYKEFLGLSHAKRGDQMTPDPRLTDAEREWMNKPSALASRFLTTDDGSLSSESRAEFFKLGREERANVMKGLLPDGQQGKRRGGGLNKDATECGNKSLLACTKIAKRDAADKAAEAAESLANSAFGRIAQSAVDAAEWSMKSLMTAWLKYPEPKVSKCYGGSEGCGSRSVSAWTQAHLHWLVVFAMTGAIMIGAIRMMLTGRGEHARELGAGLVRMIVVAFGAGTVIVTGLQAADLYSEWILDQSNFEVGGSIFAAGAIFAGLTNPFLLLFLGLIVLLVQIIQLGLMAIRTGMVLLLAGFLPLASSFSNTASGRQWMSKSIQWMVAWILYKPVAATIYAVAIQMTHPRQDIATQLSGVFMMILAILALPALMRFAVPLVSAASGGNSGAIAAGVTGGLIATGAVMASSGGTAMAAGFAGATATGGRPGGGGGSGGGSTGGITAAPSGSGSPDPAASPGSPSGAPGGGRPDVVEPAADGAPAASGPGTTSPGGAGASAAGQQAGSTASGGLGAGSAGSPPGGTAPGGSPSSPPAASSGASAAAAAPQSSSPPRRSGGSTPASAAYTAAETAQGVSENTSGAIESERHA